MLVTKHAAELCALLVNDLHGELPSRILIALLTKGRCTVTQLIQHTSLNTRQLRNGLGVLFQQNLLYTRTDSDTRITAYDANPDACYNLVRSGKVLDAVDRQFGSAERDLMQTLLQLGHARINDLSQAFASRNALKNGKANGSNGHGNGIVASEDDLLVVLARLIQADLVETVRPESFRNPVDVFHEIRAEATKVAPGEKAGKNKIEQQTQILTRWRTYREQGKAIKRQLDQTRGSAAKRRKLHNGRAANGDTYEESVPQLSPNIVVRVNHEKCLVDLRNHCLANFAADALGEVTGEVYRTLLSLLTVELARCRQDNVAEDDSPPPPPVSITTLDILDHLDESVNVSNGLGKVSKENLNVSSVEKIKAAPPQSDDESEDSDSGEPVRRLSRPAMDVDLDDEDDDDESEDDDDEDDDGKQKPKSALKTNGDRQPKVKFKEEAPPVSRLDQVRQHLLLLKESKSKFIRHCGTAGRGQWTVDFEQLMNRIRETELDAVIEQSFGRYGLRLTRILREKGKLDEKMLHSAALMRKPDVQGKMLALQMAGLVDIQEVPKDSSRLANRTIFLWFFDGERTQAQLLDDVYKAMLRSIQALQVQRHKERNILSFVERKDVQGKEEEVMTAEHYNKYNQHLEAQEKLLGQIMRLDDMISIFRDF